MTSLSTKRKGRRKGSQHPFFAMGKKELSRVPFPDFPFSARHKKNEGSMPFLPLFFRGYASGHTEASKKEEEESYAIGKGGES